MSTPHLSWQPLTRLHSLFRANLAALATRDPELAERLDAHQPAGELFVALDGDSVHIARKVGDSLELIPASVDAIAAGQIAARLCPTDECVEPLLIAGLSRGWLWNALYELPTRTPAAPGHRAPLYLLAGEIERLWMACHLHDWQRLLADERVRLFVGADAVAKAQASMAACLDVPMPRLSVTLEPALWSDGQTIDSMTAAVLASANARMDLYKARAAKRDATRDVEGTFASGRKLRVMGITSRYTTFLQHSMRDWLESFAALGHQTHLVIEANDASLANPMMFAGACDLFDPDLIVMIDHYRAELVGLPSDVPFVMWVQDQLPNIFSKRAGAAQSHRDYAIGYGRLQCVHELGYPDARFRPAMVGTNERRFQPRRLTHEERDAHTCDVSFVSHCSTPAEVLIQAEIDKQSSPGAKRVLSSVFEQLRSEYDAGRSVTMQSDFRRMIESALRAENQTIENPAALLNLFTHKINNALFRHQSLRWLAEMDVRLNLYGRGWEQNAEFIKFARGPADNATALSAIYQASRINLQVSPFGSAHQRVFDGLAAGGFFLLRQCPGDRADVIYRDLWNWCEDNHIRHDSQLEVITNSDVVAAIAELTRLNGHSPFGQGYDFVRELSVTAESAFSRNSATLWNEYEQVSYDTREQLQARVMRFLTNDAERAIITRSMRARVLESLTYRAVARQTIDLVRADVSRGAIAIAA